MGPELREWGLWGRNGGCEGYGAEMVVKRVISVATLALVEAARLLECFFFWGGYVTVRDARRGFKKMI